MLWLTVSNAFDKPTNTPNVYLVSLKELYILFTSSIRACSVESKIYMFECPYLSPSCLSNSRLFLGTYS